MITRQTILLLLCGLIAAAEAPRVSLAEAVRIAQAENPTVAVARARVAEAQAVQAQSRAAWQPMVGLSAGYSYMDYPVATFGSILNQEAFQPTIDFNDTPQADDLSLSLNAGYRLYDGGRRSAEEQAARAAVAAATAGHDGTRRQVAFLAAQTWLQNYQARQQLAAAEAMQAALTTHLATARSHLQQGTMTETDVLEVQVRLQEIEEQVLRARNQSALAASALGNLLGRSEALMIDDQLPALSVPADGAARPELAAALARITAAENGIEAERAGHLPHVDAFGTVAYHDGFELDQADGRLSWMAGLRVQMTVWDGALTANRVHAAESRLLAARHQQRRTELTIALQQTEARLALDNARQRLAVAEQAVTLADKHVQLTTARFAEGLTTVTRMVDAEAAHTAATIRLTNAQADVLLATTALRHALGRGIIEED